MPIAWRKFLLGLVLLLAAGTVVGWLYGRPVLGLLIATLAALTWQVRQLLAFDRALRTRDFDNFRHGDGIWQQIFARFTHERDRSHKHKDRYRELLREIRKSTNAMPDGAVIIDINNEIVTSNRAAKRLAGLKPKKDKGQRVDNILREPALTRLLHEERPTRSVDIASPVREGEWLNCRVVPYGADQKLLLLRDITDRLRLNKMRRDFVANASHELRSPLTVISGYLDSLAEDADIPGDWVQPVAQMQAQAQRMNRIVAELLELSRLESGGRAGTESLVDVAALLETAGRSHGRQPGDPAVIVRTESTAMLRGNNSQIESVVDNLLSNAVRHTGPDGEVTVTWRSDGKGAELVVEDTGEGIPAEQIPRLTERFFRGDRGRSRDDGGIGLGLAIVKHALGRHDAELSISSEPGVGSRFSCSFPATRVVMDGNTAVASKTGTA
jgi:two-component system phosphate regulon sensor histidine kinase PhoR